MRVCRDAIAVVVVVLVTLGLAGPVQAQAPNRPRIGASSAWASPQSKARWVRRPVLNAHAFADPSVVRWHREYVGVATGKLAPRSRATSPAGPWRPIGTALARRPRWAWGRSIWAGDMVRVGPRWLLYFAAPVRGLGDNGRCIGVAVAARPTARFRPVGRRPLVCPRAARTPVAHDAMDNRDPALPHRGAIDAEAFRAGKRHYLVYRTQGTPSSIRMVRLTGDGTGVRRGGLSRELVRADDIIENPVLLRRGRGFYLLTSQGYYGDCGYRTTWRRTTNLWDWSRSRSRRLMDRGSTGLCGPGGADVVASRVLRGPGVKRALVFLHAWTCPGVGACRDGDHGAARTMARHSSARRSLYAAWLWWRRGWPRVTSFVVPTRNQPTPPAPASG